MEPNSNCEGAYLDIAHSLSLYPNKDLDLNNETLFLQSNFIIYTAGFPNKQSESRLASTEKNIQLTKQIFGHRTFSNNPNIVVITNPVDIISYYVQKFSGLSADRVIGTGTFIDSIRLAFYLSKLTKHHTKEIQTLVVGEHGDSQVPVVSNCYIKGNSIINHPDFSINTLQKAYDLTKKAAFEIRKTQQGTTYGVSTCASTLLEMMLDKKTHEFPLSMQTNEHYRKLLQLETDIYIGLPVKMTNGVLSINNHISFSESEINKYRESAHLIAKLTNNNSD